MTHDHTEAEARLLALLGNDSRVVGVAQRSGPHGAPHVIVASTWDGLDGLATRLRDLAAAWLGDTLLAADTREQRLDALGVGGGRVRVEIRRMGDMKPSAEGETADPVLDPKGLMQQWAQWSRGRRPDPAADDRGAASRERVLVELDALVRDLARPLAPGRQIVRPRGDTVSLRQRAAALVRQRLDEVEVPAGALRERADAALAGIPHPAAGIRVTGRGARERFLAVADSEGFLGDRPLLDSAEETLCAIAGREPEFVEGFALATFDAVEARYSLGDAVGGCQPPLTPGVYVGVGVTPTDALEFWAAPCVSEPLADFACIADTGSRTVVERTAGREALFAALTDAVEDAHERLPSLLRRARGAHRETLGDPRGVLRALHLPATFIAAAGLHGAFAPGVNRLFAALALARAAADMDPIVARKFALAAGRCLLAASEDGAEPCAS